MDCYFHSNVPSVSSCSSCGKPICATCRDIGGSCPSCRLAAKVDAAAATRQRIPGGVPPHAQAYTQQQAQPTVVRKAEVSTLSDPVESRALVALGYPLWPLALLSVFDRKQSHRLRSAAFQALGLNVGVAGMYGLLALLSQIPFLGFSAGILMPLLIPLFLVASVYYGIKTWNGDEIRVPIIGDWIEDRLATDPSH
ncbi:MAG TPA: hypothetical protein VGF18_10155 [Candidatus Tumulicola sp.]|jgi:uncharacterized membrane protein